jgi:hypothetical protein
MSRVARLACFLACLLSLLAGCPTPPPDERPAPSTIMPTPPPSPVPVKPARLQGGWTLSVTSESPDLPPEMFDTPEKRAKVFFDHAASVEGDRVVVEHKTLGKRFDDEGSQLDALLTKTEWAKVDAAVKNDPPSEGGTVFHFTIAVGPGPRVEIVTSQVEKHPELTQLLDELKRITSVP